MKKMNKLQQGRDLAKNIFKAAAGFATSKLEILDAKEKARRLAICASCEYFNTQKYQCKVCGCKGRFLKLKASVNLWKCPYKKWEQTTNFTDADLGYCLDCQGQVVKLVEKDDKTFAQCVNGCICTYSPEAALINTPLEKQTRNIK